jgi:hypothetical protein
MEVAEAVMAPMKDHGHEQVLVLVVTRAMVQILVIQPEQQHLQVLVQEQLADIIQAPMVYQPAAA